MNIARSLVLVFAFTSLLTLQHSATAATSSAEPGKGSERASSTSSERESASGRELDYKSMFKGVTWQEGPATGDLQGTAQIQVPKGFIFTHGDGTRKVLERWGNLTSGNEVGFVAPTSLVWSVFFQFSPDGYIKDDEKDKLDAAKMLKSITESVEESNTMRKERGIPTMKILGWEQPPHYDSETHNLEWALRAESKGGHQIVNYNTRMLGRRGVMEAKLIVDPEELSKTLPEFKDLLKAYDFKTGERYAEYKQGDKLASYGLAALVTGGAVAVAAKTGLLTAMLLFLKKASKLVIVAIIGIAVGIKRLITGRSNRDE